MPDLLHNEAVLVEQAIQGDADAFGELYLFHLDAIYRYIYFRVGDVGDAEDLTEQVFIKAWEALPGYQPRGHPFKSWLYRIAHNLIVDYHRRQRAGVIPLPDDRDYASQQPPVLEQIIKAEEMSALAKAVAQLTEDQQQVILLRFVEGLGYDEVAHILHKSQAACRVLQHRTLVALNRLLASTRRS